MNRPKPKFEWSEEKWKIFIMLRPNFFTFLCSSLTPILGKEMNEARINGWVVFVCSYERTPISNHKNHTIVSQRQTISSLYDPKRPLWKLRSILCTYTLFNHQPAVVLSTEQSWRFFRNFSLFIICSLEYLETKSTKVFF